MASIVQGVTVLADGLDLSGTLKSLESMGETEMHDSTALGTTGFRSFVPGLTERGVQGEGMWAYDGTTDAFSLDKAFHDEHVAGANRLISVGFQGSAIGATAKLYNTKQVKYSIKETIGQIIMANFETKVTADVANSLLGYAKDGVWLMNQAVTGTVNGTTFDDGAGATTGWLAHCHVTADNFSNMVVKVQHSTDGSSWADLISFTAFSTIGAQQASNTVTSVNRFIRAIVSTFTGTSAQVAVAIKTGFTG